ncbi:MAG: hypothetical protein ACRCY8_00885, partial [Dermatophilaceae bacterium]
MHRLPVRQLRGFLRGVHLRRLRLPHLQPRHLLVRALLGQLRRVRLLRLHLPHLHPRGLTASAEPPGRPFSGRGRVSQAA